MLIRGFQFLDSLTQIEPDGLHDLKFFTKREFADLGDAHRASKLWQDGAPSQSILSPAWASESAAIQDAHIPDLPASRALGRRSRGAPKRDPKDRNFAFRFSQVRLGQSLALP